jgi:uracil-DNA glycosylase
MDSKKIKLDKKWKDALGAEFKGSCMADLCSFIENVYASGKQIYPRKSEIFAAFDLTRFDKVKVVVIGQDPYHGPGQAHGLCFSFHGNGPLPRSLRNIFEELRREFGFEMPASGNLSKWTEQGVLLLNMALTVEEGKPGAHQLKWKCFADAVIKTLTAKKENLVFIAWGNEAQKAVAEIDTERHEVLKSAHPSPFSCHRGFRGNNHFELANKYLRKTKQEPIDWQL